MNQNITVLWATNKCRLFTINLNPMLQKEVGCKGVDFTTSEKGA